MLLFATITVSAQSTAYPTVLTEKADKAIIVIDMQNDFVEPNGVLCITGAKATIPVIAELLKYGRNQKWKIIYIVREHHPSGLDVDAPRIPLFINGKKATAFLAYGAARSLKGSNQKRKT